VSGWQRGWRVLIVWVSGYAPGDEREQLVDAHTVVRLRELVLWARRDPRVDNYGIGGSGPGTRPVIR
jgi:hypothetical protein